MPRTEVFLSCFRAVDEVVQDSVLPRRLYPGAARISRTGVRESGILYIRAVPRSATACAIITAFLDVMEFASRRIRPTPSQRPPRPSCDTTGR